MAMSHLALLRGINVGGNNMIKMTELTSLFLELGFKDPKTYIQSGNVVFNASAKQRKGLQDKLRLAIEARFGLKIPVVVLDRAELEAAIANNPYPEAVTTHKLLNVGFLAEVPTAENLAKLDPLRSTPDRYQVIGRCIYVHLTQGAADTKLTNAYFDARLNTISTGRNWQTVATLMEWMR